MKNNDEFVLLSLYATAKFNSVNCEDKQRFYANMNAVSMCISALGYDEDGNKRYDIDIIGNISGYRNFNRISDKVYFNNNL
jgi:hypothetical protein